MYRNFASQLKTIKNMYLPTKETAKVGQEFFVVDMNVSYSECLLQTTDISKVADFLSKETDGNSKVILREIANIMNSELPYNLRTYANYSIVRVFNKG